MSHPFRRAALLTACGLVLAGPVGAKCFSAANTTLRPILVTDFASSMVLPDLGPLTSCFRDFDNNPCPYPTVTIDFTPCGSSVEIAEFQERSDVVVNCSARTISMNAGADGCVILGPFLARTDIQVTGWPQAPGDSPSRNIGPDGGVGPCANVYVEGFLMGTVPVQVVRYDSDSDADVDAGDLGFTLDAIGHFLMGPPPTSPYRTFYDYDWDGDIDAGDAAAVLDAIGLYFQGVRTPYQGPYCP